MSGHVQAPGEGTGGGFTTSGGPASIHADLDTLEAAAAHLDELGDRARRCRALLDEVFLHLNWLAARTPGAAHARTVALDAHARLVMDARDLAATAAHVREAAAGYRRAEHGARAIVATAGEGVDVVVERFLERTRDGASTEDLEYLLSHGHAELTHAAVSALVVIGIEGAAAKGMTAALKPAGALGRWAAEIDGLASRRLDREFKAHDFLVGLMTPPEELLPEHLRPEPLLPDPVDAAGDAVADWVMGRQQLSPVTTLNGQAGLAASVVARRHVNAGLPLEMPAPVQRLSGTVGDLAALQASEDTPAHAVSVTEVLAQDGVRTWVVAIPGTQLSEGLLGEWNGPGGIAEGLGHGSERTGEGIARALVVAGVPAGARVVFMGHSQGGLHAVNLSRHEAITKDYRVAGVVTFGAPTGGAAAAEGVPTLNLLDDSDGAAALDGGPDPVSASRATVTFHTPPKVLPHEALRQVEEFIDRHGHPAGWGADPRIREEAIQLLEQHGQSLFAGHGMDGYLRHARTLDAADAGAVADIRPTLTALAALTAGQVGRHVVVPLRVGERSAQDSGRQPVSEPRGRGARDDRHGR